nr:neuropeptide F [Hymenolepis microstoma]
MFLLSTPFSIYLMVILTILLPLNRASVNFDDRRLAKALRQKLLTSSSDLLNDEFDYVKRAEADLTDRILNDPAALRDYLRQINEYFAIIGRPRFG